MATEKLSNETTAQKEAFEIYYALGSKRSLKVVAQQAGKTERTVAGWSRSFNWRARITQREIDEANNRETNNISAQTMDVRTRYRIIMNNLIARATEKMAKGELEIKSISDMERVVKLDLLLMGEATEKVDRNGVVEFSKADRDRFDKVAKLLENIED